MSVHQVAAPWKLGSYQWLWLVMVGRVVGRRMAAVLTGGRLSGGGQQGVVRRVRRVARINGVTSLSPASRKSRDGDQRFAQKYV